MVGNSESGRQRVADSGARTGISRRAVLGGGAGAAAVAAIGGTWAGLSGSAGPPTPPPHVGQPPPRPGRKPNVVLIVLDDLGAGDLSAQGSRVINTPRIDSVGAEGMTFHQMYAGAPVCTPSRAALLTGRYAQRMGLASVTFPQDQRGLPNDERTVADLLRESGYRTGIFGKWHLGDPARRADLNPQRHGFERFFGLPYSHDLVPLPLYDGEQVVDDVVDAADQTQLTRRYTDEAIRFIQDNKDDPFFVYLPHSSPHRPFHLAEAARGRSEAGRYGDAVEEVDFHVGRVLDELDRLGLTENTLVMVTSDNGPWFQGATGGLRGRKRTTFEGGIRVPFFARWPERIRAGSSCDQPACFVDVLPSLATLAGAQVPRDRPIDGVDLGPALRGGRVQRGALYLYNEWSLNAVRSGPWKLHRSLYPAPGPPMPLLFNIDRDREEQRNVAARHPRMVRRLSRMAERFEREIAGQRREAERRARGRT